MPIDFRPDTAWPPRDVQHASHYYREWLAWYRGDVRVLREFYASMATTGNVPIRPSQMAGGVYGALGRFFWGRPVVTNGQVRQHVPAAKDVASLAAGMLFADPPDFALPDLGASSNEQKALDTLVAESGVYPLLHESAERGSAAGGVYIRLSANAAAADGPIGEAILPDRAAGEFYGPWCTAVTFWRVLSDPQATPVVRHLERHEMTTGPKPVCVVYHAVYVGGPDKLGRPAPLADYPETERLAALVDADGRIVIGTSKLDVVYVKNVGPHLDSELDGGPLGRSDFAGAEPQMDQLDETWSSWMRDIRLGKGRLIVPKEYTRRLGDGRGGFFDPEQEIFQQVNAQPGAADSPTLAITAAQFAIRVTEHAETAKELWRIILKNAGMDGNEQDEERTPTTATGVMDKASRKRGTRAIKIQYWTPQLRRLLFVMQELQRIYWPGSAAGQAAPPDIEWPDSSAPDMQTMAQTLQLLDAAGAVSTKTKVEMLHPDWDGDQVTEEVELIDTGSAPPPMDPANPGGMPMPSMDPAGGPADPQPVGNSVDDQPPGD